MVKTIAFALYPGITALDLVGPLQVMSALAEFDDSDPEPPLGAIDSRNVDADLFAPTVRSMLQHALTDHPDLLARRL